MGKVCSEAGVQAWDSAFGDFLWGQEASVSPGWVFSRAPQGRRNNDEEGVVPTLRAQWDCSVRRKGHYKGLNFVKDYHICELRSSQMMILFFLIWKLVESRCKSLDDSAILLVGSQHKPKGLRYIFPVGCFPFSFLSLLLMLCPSITFTTVPCHFLLPPTPGDILSL